MYLKVNHRNRPDCIVMLCKDCATHKWCYINLSTEHVCSCRFDTMQEAIDDMNKRADVVSWSWMNNPFVPSESANAIDHKLPALDPSVYRAMIEQSLKDVEELDNHLADLIVKNLRETKSCINENIDYEERKDFCTDH